MTNSNEVPNVAPSAQPSAEAAPETTNQKKEVLVASILEKYEYYFDVALSLAGEAWSPDRNEAVAIIAEKLEEMDRDYTRKRQSPDNGASDTESEIDDTSLFRTARALVVWNLIQAIRGGQEVPLVEPELSGQIRKIVAEEF